jgi:hypothetical protein
MTEKINNNEERYNLQPSPNAIKAIKSTRMRWRRGIDKKCSPYRILTSKSEGRKPVGWRGGGARCGWRFLLKWILIKM